MASGLRRSGADAGAGAGAGAASPFASAWWRRGQPPIPAVAAARRPAARSRAPPSRRAAAAVDSRRSDNYYDIKSDDLQRADRHHRPDPARPARPESAREEIRDIVNEIIALKNVVMSIAEQEELLEDICNDVLGYGPLEPLLARDDIADIMVNGAEHLLHRSRRQGAARPTSASATTPS